MNAYLTYLFWPNPGNAYYSSPKVMALLILCALLVLGSFAVSYWRKNYASAAVRKISKSWSPAMFWFGLVGLVLVVARVEQIQFLAMRALWGVWAALVLLVVYLQVRMYRNRYYEVLPATQVIDQRSKYLPKRKHR